MAIDICGGDRLIISEEAVSSDMTTRPAAAVECCLTPFNWIYCKYRNKMFYNVGHKYARKYGQMLAKLVHSLAKQNLPSCFYMHSLCSLQRHPNICKLF